MAAATKRISAPKRLNRAEKAALREWAARQTNWPLQVDKARAAVNAINDDRTWSLAQVAARCSKLVRSAAQKRVAAFLRASPFDWARALPARQQALAEQFAGHAEARDRLKLCRKMFKKAATTNPAGEGVRIPMTYYKAPKQARGGEAGHV